MAIRAARVRQAEARTGKMDIDRRNKYADASDALMQLTKVPVASRPSLLPSSSSISKKDFLSRVADYSRLGEAVKDPTSEAGLRQIGLRSLEPIGRSLFKAAAVPEEQQAQPQGVQSIQPNQFVPRLSREVGGLRGITVPATSNLPQRIQSKLLPSKEGLLRNITTFFVLHTKQLSICCIKTAFY